MAGADTLRPEEFAAVLDEWRTNGGALHDRIPRGHRISTVAEAKAVCRALSSSHIYTAVDSIETLALSALASFFQSVASDQAASILRDEGLPLLRRILIEALQLPQDTDAEDWVASRRREAHLFLLKILAMYEQAGDGPLIVRAARHPSTSQGYIWSVILGIVAERHPDAVEICEGLRGPLPDGFLGIAYLDFANGLALQQRISCHPFDTEAGLARLVAYLADRKPENYSYAVSATASIPFLGVGARETLMHSADQHPDWLVRLEAARALAKTGSEFGPQRLAQLCLNPRFAERAIGYLEELGLGAHIPTKSRDSDFLAMAGMCSWLAHPMEFGRPPDHITQYDTRVPNWPPTGDRRRLWLFKYRYEPQGEDRQPAEGISLVGSVTFALFGEATANLAPEDVYALHCCWELQTNQDPRTPKDRTAAIGRKLLAETNPGFGGA